MPSKSKFTRDDNGNIAVRVVSSDSSVTNSDSMFTTDENGNVAVRVVGSGGGGGGDQHNLGYYETPEALIAAHPTATAGDFAIVNSTDTVWIWDTDTSAWKDGDTKGQVTSVNNKTGAVTLTSTDILPDQTGNSGKFLKTNGTATSWGSAVENIANGQRSFIVGGDNTNSTNDFISIGYSTSSTVSSLGGVYCVQIGGYAQTSNAGGTSIGYSSTATGAYSTALGNSCNAGSGGYNVALGAKVSISNSYCVAIGANTKANSSSIAIGGAANNYTSAEATNNSIAIGCNAHATATKSIQLGEGTNSTANTFKVANTNGNYTMMDADGTIPADRIADTTGLTAGNYIPRLTIDAQGNKTITWVAE